MTRTHVPIIWTPVPVARTHVPKSGPASRFQLGWHLFGTFSRKGLREAYGWFYAAYRDAAEELRKGDRASSFPERSFPPALPFVRHSSYAAFPPQPSASAVASALLVFPLA